jgi:acid phosphatase (class A)
MSPLRRLIIAVLLAAMLETSFAASFRPAHAESDGPYLGATDLDLASVLPPPVANGSAEDRAQQQIVLAAQRAASPARLEQVRHDADESVFAMFGGVLGDGFNEAALPATAHLFARLAATEDAVVTPAKTAFARRHPWESDPAIKPLTVATRAGSYPSGHTTRVNLDATVLADLLPQARTAIWQRAADYAESRVIGGMHYPNDIEGGRRAGTAIAVALLSRIDYRIDVEAARSELHAKLAHPGQ